MTKPRFISRRAFIGGSAAATLLTLAPPSMARALAGTVPQATATPATLTRSDFVPLLGRTLRMSGEGDDIDVTLAAIGDVGRPGANAENSFVLVFRARAGQPRTQGLRTFQHGSIKDVGIFVSPVDRGVHELTYEAVFNRL